MIRSQYRNPKNFLFDYNSLFDLLALTPEANHAGMMFFSDHGTPDGWTNNHGYGCHTFKWVNKDGEFVYVKYHFLAKHGQKQFAAGEATELSGQNPDYSKRELWDKMENGEEVEYVAHVQLMKPDEADASLLGFDPFDVTKVWPKRQFPVCSFITPLLPSCNFTEMLCGNSFKSSAASSSTKIPRISIATSSKLLSHLDLWYPASRIAPTPFFNSGCFSTAMHSTIVLVSTCTRFLSTARSW